MSFAGIETSEYSGELVLYFAFTVGETVYRYNTSNQALSIGGHEFTPYPIALSEAEHGRDTSTMRVRVSVPRDNPVALLFRQAVPDVEIPVVVSAKHQSDSEVIGAWSGSVLSCEWRESEAQLTCEPALAKMRRLALRMRFQPTCNLVTYSARCGVDPNDFKSTVTVSTVSGLGVTVSGMPAVADGYYNGGFARDTNGTRRFISEQVGNALTFLVPFESIANGDSLEIFAGDDHTHETCRSKFFPAGGSLVDGVGNIENFFGVFTLPDRNPFTQGGLTGKGAIVNGNGIIPG